MTANIAALPLRPGRERARGETLVVATLAVAVAGWLYAVVGLVTQGHALLGTASYGAAWGVTVANVIHVIGISHVGIAVSAAVRLLRLERYRHVSRLAEVMTLVALVVAVLNIALDVGRPDRFLIGALIHGQWHAPMVWSATVISLYFVSSSVYLYLSLRRDLWLLGGGATSLQRVYRALALGYQDTAAARERHAVTLRWLALVLVPVMVSVHSVYGLFFGMLSAKAGWYNPLQAPYFVLGAVVSGFSALIVAMAILRRLYRWEEIIDERTCRVFGAFLSFVVFLFLYFVVSEHLTAQFAAPPEERGASAMLLTGPYARMFWPTIAGGLVLPFFVLLWQALRSRPASVATIATAAGVINVAMLLKRVLLVVPAQESPRLPLPMPVGPYQPTLLELVVTLGTYGVGGLLFMVALKWLPLIERPLSSAVDEGAPASPRGRLTLIGATFAAGVALVAWGVVTRTADFAPLKWITGLCLFAIVPLEHCALRGGRAGREVREGESREAGGGEA